MRTGAVLIFVTVLLTLGCKRNEKAPLAPVKTVSDNYFGVNIDDPYRYMENMDDTIFLAWMKKYAEYSRGILDEIPGRSSLLDQMVEFDARRSDKIYWLEITEDGRYFYLKTAPEDQTPKLFYRNNYTANEELLYDPKDFSEAENVTYAITSMYPNYCGDLIGISLAPNGSENSTLILIDVARKKVLPDRIEQFMGMMTWLKDDRQFYYGKSNSTDIHDPTRILNTKIYGHILGNLQSQDRLIFSSDQYPEVGMKPEEIPYILYDNDQDDYFLLLYTVEKYQKLFHSPGKKLSSNERFEWKQLIRKEDQIQDFYTIGDKLYLYTAKNANGFELLQTSVSDPDIENADVIVAESEEGMLSSFAFTNEALYYTIKINGVEEKLYRLSADEDSVQEIHLPAKAGTLSIDTRGHKFADIWVSVLGWTVDGKRYRYNAENDSFSSEPLSSEATYPEYDSLVVEEVMIPSHDGVMVPLSVIYLKGTPLNGTAPLLMTGYGAYGVSRIPAFNPYMLMWTLEGGIYAVSHVRGGGELGDSWRLGGQKKTKPNTWKDFIASAEYLINSGYTSPKHLAVYGVSAGGILVGRALTERPDLFAAVIPLVGVLNPVRAEQSPNGPVNAPEFGTVKDSLECMALLEMDPYLNINEEVNYPATFITAGFNDPRVIVWQPAKFAAKMRAANNSDNPILFDVDYSSGHGAGDPKTKSFEDLVDLFAFALWQTGHSDFQKK